MKAFAVRLAGMEVAVLAEGKGKTVPRGIILPPGPINIVHPLEGKSIFRNGWHSWSFAGWIEKGTRPLSQALPDRWAMMDHPACFEGEHILSSGIAAVGAPDGDSLLLGGLGPGGWIEIEENFLKGGYWGKPSGWFLACGPTTELFAHYAHHLASQSETSARGVGRAPRVWCSWYSFYREIDEKILLKVVKGLRGIPIDVIQIDDGWQKGIGDWEENERFSHGFKALAKRIKKAGFTPGIWLAPLIARENSRLIRKHPEWLLKNKNNQPVSAGINWGGIFYALDISRREVVEWIKQIISRLWKIGFRYLKLDFLYAGALPDQGGGKISPEATYRSALSEIREAWGDGYLLACGAPIIASLGLCNGLRIGPDVAPYWSDGSNDPTAPGARNALSTSSSRVWLKPLVQIDPDVVFFRTRYNLLTSQEKRVIQDLAFVCSFKGTSLVRQEIVTRGGSSSKGG